MVTPVSSPTPDEQAAEEAERQRKVDLALPFGRAMIQEDLQDGKSYTLLNPEAMLALIDDYATVRASLVVVREQLAAEQAAIHADLTALLEALGMGTHARPESPHQVMTACIEAARSDREQLTQVEAANAALVSALERTRDNFVAAVRGTPVRDMAETLAEVDAALPSPPTYTTEEPSSHE